MPHQAGKPLVISHIFEAPRPQVWKLWTDSKYLAAWWSPDNFTIPECKVDVRPGGQISLRMQGPDGTIYPVTGEYREVYEPERLVFTTTPLDPSGQPLFEVLNTAVFNEAGSKTRLDLELRVLSATAAAAPYLAGMEIGWRQSLNKQELIIKEQ